MSQQTSDNQARPPDSEFYYDKSNVTSAKLSNAKKLFWLLIAVYSILELALAFLYFYHYDGMGLWILIVLGIGLSLVTSLLMFASYRRIKKLRIQIKEVIYDWRRFLDDKGGSGDRRYIECATRKETTLKPLRWFLAGLISFFIFFWMLMMTVWILKNGKSVVWGRGSSERISVLFEKIRDNRAKLALFFHQMPKGGDLHHHLSGSVYAESFLKKAIDLDLYIDTFSTDLSLFVKPKTAGKKITSLRSLSLSPRYQVWKQRLMQQWSIRDYGPLQGPADLLFFESFSKFSPAKDTSYLRTWAREIRERAITEGVQYIETSIGAESFRLVRTDSLRFVNLFRAIDSFPDLPDTDARFTAALQLLREKGITNAAESWLQKLTAGHWSAHIDDSLFKLRYQISVSRNRRPADFFKEMIMAFELAAKKDSLVVGVNILSREDGDIALRDYALHMRMFQFCRKRYPTVLFAMHAGEFTLGTVLPENMRNHIRDAVLIAGSRRIGHGTDISFEQDAGETLKKMHKDSIAVEINLSSNEFILGLKDDQHPLTVYQAFGVPVVICTDDAGILRSNLTQQFVLLAYRYPSYSYTDIRDVIFNSIRYSFLPAPVREAELKKLGNRFREFETSIVKQPLY